jgi:hypothetical protein
MGLVGGMGFRAQVYVTHDIFSIGTLRSEVLCASTTTCCFQRPHVPGFPQAWLSRLPWHHELGHSDTSSTAARAERLHSTYTTSIS